MTPPGKAPAIIAAKSSRFPSIIYSKTTQHSPLDRPDPPDFLLQQQHAIQQGLRGWRTTRHIDIDWYDSIAATHYRIRIMVVAAAVGAGPHGNNIARLRHLVVDLAQSRRHLIGKRAGDDHHVRLAGRRARRKTKALGVITRHRHLHHFDGATGKPECHPHQRAGTRPGDEIIARRDQKALVGKFVVEAEEKRIIRSYRFAGVRIDNAGRGWRHAGRRLRRQSHSRAPLRHSYTKPTVRTPRNSIMEQNPKKPRLSKATAQGNRKLTSRSKMMKRIATR